MNSSPICPLCNGQDECTLHAMRDCTAATQVWIPLVKSDSISSFFSGSLQEWLVANLNSSMGMCGRDEWRAVFM